MFRKGLTIASLVAALGITGVAHAQNWEEPSDIEWDAESGYHEEEWYDPSDWFDTDEGIEYETDDWSWGADGNQSYYNDDYFGEDSYYWDDTYYGSDDVQDDVQYGSYEDQLDYGWDYNALSDEWEYGWHYDDFGDYDVLDYDTSYEQDALQAQNQNQQAQQQRQQRMNQQFNQQQQRSQQQMNQQRRQQQQFSQQNQQQGQRSQLTGRVVGLESIGARDGSPESVQLRIRTQDGREQTLLLGDLSYARENLPQFRTGEDVVIGGRVVQQGNRRLFKAEEIRSAQGQYTIPQYEYNRRIEGTLTGLRTVRLQGSNVQAVVAQVRSDDGQTRQVLLGNTQNLQGAQNALRPGSRARIDGYSRTVNGENVFVVQDFRVRGQQQGQQAQQQSRQVQQQRMNRQQQQDQQRRQQMSRQQNQNQFRGQQQY